MQKKIFISLLLLMTTIGSWAAKADKSVSIKVNGTTRSYWLYVPSSVKADTPTPLVFSLHGTGGHSTDKSPFRTSVADTKGCIVVYPQGSDIYFPVFGGTLPGWNSIGETSVDIDFFKAIIEEVNKTYAVDRERIYCCGFSNGGMMTYTVANVASDIFAAFASISGFPLNEFHLHHSGARPVPFLHIHGKADDFVKYSLMPSIVDNMVSRVGAKPVPVKRTVSGKYVRSTYGALEGGFPYVYYEVDGMGHSDYTDNTVEGNSALTMWNFMSQYTLSSECDTTLKWRPNIEFDNYTPKTHGWIMNTSTTLLMYGREQKTDANQNVYRSLQFEKGKYKLCFHSESETAKTLTVKLQKLTGSKPVVLNQEVEVGKDITLFFEVTDGWGEYKFTVLRPASTDVVTVSNLAIYSATDEEVTSITSPSINGTDAPLTSQSSSTYSLSGALLANTQKGINIVNGKKYLVK